jgi:succinate dehydrogenase/fumarate reductase flavoprotein subunit
LHDFYFPFLILTGGLSGLCAVIEAVRCGASVVLIEKEKTIGGNSAKATSGIVKKKLVDTCKKSVSHAFKDGLSYFVSSLDFLHDITIII